MAAMREEMTKLGSGGGVQLGPTDGPQIVIAGLQGVGDDWRAIADRIALDPRTVWRSLSIDEGSGMKLGWVGIQGSNAKSGGDLILFHPGDQSIFDALHIVELYEHRVGRGLSPAVAAACAAAALGLQRGLNVVDLAPAMYGRMVSTQPCSAPSRLSDEEIRSHVAAFIGEVKNGKLSTAVPAGVVDRAKYWIELCRTLWTPEIRQTLSQVFLSGEVVHELSRLASAWLRLNLRPFVKVAGVSLRVSEKMMDVACPQVMEWERGCITKRVLRYLTGYRNELPDIPQWARDTTNKGSQCSRPEIDGDQANRISRTLLNEVGGRARCKPGGSFRVGLPENTPLSIWGVNTFRVWVDPPDAMWVTLECGDRMGPSFRWRVGSPKISQWVLPEDAASVLYLMVVALRRDLSVAGEALMGLDARTENPHDCSTRKLPVVRFGGLIDWGAGKPSVESSKNTSIVAAHLRRLPRGKRPSRQALIRARCFGIHYLPKGTTFVRPHERKVQENSVVRNSSSYVQGLLSVMTIFGTDLRDGLAV